MWILWCGVASAQESVVVVAAGWRSQDHAVRDETSDKVLARWNDWSENDLAALERLAEGDDAETAGRASAALEAILLRRRFGARLVAEGIDEKLENEGLEGRVVALGKATFLRQIGELSAKEMKGFVEYVQGWDWGIYGEVVASCCEHLPEWREVLLKIARHGESDAPAEAVGSLGSIGEPSESIATFLEGGDWERQSAAIFVLLRRKNSRWAERILALLDEDRFSGEWAVRCYAEWLLQEGEAERVARLLARPGEGGSSYIVSLFAEQGGDDLLPVLRPYLASDRAQVREAAARALAGTRNAATDIARLLDDPVPSVRAAAASSLGRIGAKEHGPRVLALLQDEDTYVRSAAASALATLASLDDVTRLRELYEKEVEPGTRFAILETLARLDPFHSRELLDASLASPDEYVPLWTARILLEARCYDRLSSIFSAGAELHSFDGEVDAGRFTRADLRFLAPVLRDRGVRFRESLVWVAGRLGGAELRDVMIPLLDEADSDLRRAVLWWIGLCGSLQDAEAARKFLDDPDSDVRRAAVETLARHEGLSHAPELVELLRTGEVWDRDGTAVLLAELGVEEAGPGIASLLEDPKLANIRTTGEHPGAAMVRALMWLGDPGEVRKALHAAAGHWSRHTRYAAIAALGRIGNEEDAAFLAGRLHAADPEYRALVVRALGEIGCPAHAPAVAELAGDPSDEVRAEMPIALRRMGRPEASVERIVAALGSGDSATRVSAAGAIVELDLRDRSANLVALLDSEDPAVVVSALDALRVLGARIESERLAPLVRSADGDVRLAALGFIASSGDARAAAEVARFLDDPVLRRRVEAARILATMLGGECEGWIREHLAGAGTFEAPALLDALGMAGGPGDVSAAVPFLVHPRVEVRRAALEAITRLGAGVGIEPVARCLLDQEPELRAIAARSLADLGACSAATALTERLGDGSPDVRLAARRALVRLGIAPAHLDDPVIENRIEEILSLPAGEESSRKLAELEGSSLRRITLAAEIARTARGEKGLDEQRDIVDRVLALRGRYEGDPWHRYLVDALSRAHEPEAHSRLIEELPLDRAVRKGADLEATFRSRGLGMRVRQPVWVLEARSVGTWTSLRGLLDSCQTGNGWPVGYLLEGRTVELLRWDDALERWKARLAR